MKKLLLSLFTLGLFLLLVSGSASIGPVTQASADDDDDCLPAPSGLVSWWPGDGNANDIAGSNHGTLHNGATFAAGLVDQAFSFDGVDDVVSTPLTVSYSGGVTFDVWVKTSDDAGLVVSDGGGSSPERGMGLFIEPGGIMGLFGTKGTFADPNFVILGPVISDGTFHHVAATWTGDTTTSGVNLYVDGVLVGTATAKASINTGSTPIHIGWHTTLGHFPFAGLIDEVEIFERALSAAEIQSLFNAGSAGKCKDADGDGVNDGEDNCPTTPNSDQADFDLDDEGDACDAETGPPRFKDQCKDGGWERFNFPRTLKDQGDCIQFVNTGN